MTDSPYVVTHTGCEVNAHEGVPSLLDIAVGLSRICRFGGQGKHFFSVLAHTLWIDDLCSSRDPRLHLALLFHDAHECVTSDVPKPLKTPDLIAVQKKIDARLDEYYSLCPLTDNMRRIVEGFDALALLAEYEVVGPGHPGHFSPPAQVDVLFLRQWMARTPWADPPGARRRRECPAEHPAVREFLRRVAAYTRQLHDSWKASHAVTHT